MRFLPRRRALRVLAAAAALALGALGWAAFVEPRRLEVTEHRLTGPVSLTLVHLSDLHVEVIGARERAVLTAVAEARPDVIVVTGDTVTALGGGLQADAVTTFLGSLKARLGVWACPGNHEDWVGAAAAACYERAGVPLLADRSVPLLEGRVVLHGLAGAAPPREMTLGTPAYDVVLCHYPAVLPRVAAPAVELVLAGHTHGGQVCLPGGHPLVLPFESGDLAAGWFEDRGTRMYVSRGVGTSVLPLRAFCRPEVAVHRIDPR